MATAACRDEVAAVRVRVSRLEKELAQVRSSTQVDAETDAAIETLLRQPKGNSDDRQSLLRRAEDLHQALALAQGGKLARYLEPDERLLWVGRPIAWRLAVSSGLAGHMGVLGIFWVCLIAAWALTSWDPTFIPEHPRFLGAAVLISIVVFLAWPGLNYLRARRIWYGISTHRALVLVDERKPELCAFRLRACGAPLSCCRGPREVGSIILRPAHDDPSRVLDPFVLGGAMLRGLYGLLPFTPPPLGSGFFCVARAREAHWILERARVRACAPDCARALGSEEAEPPW